MASSNSSNGTNELYFDTTAPTGTDFEDNASHIVTDDGTATGTPTEFHKFDADSGTWVRIPLGGPTCPAPMTRAALLALSGSYDTSCHYIITDHNRGTVGPALVEMHAVDATTLSMDVSVSTDHDNMAWNGLYDINTNRMLFLEDNLRNKVTGSASVESFPWGNASVTENTITEATFTYVSGTASGNHIETDAVVVVAGGTFADNQIDAEANVNFSGTGVFVRNTISHESNVTVTSGDFRENVVFADALVNSSTTGDVDNNEFGSLSVINVSGASNVDANIIKQSSNLTISGGALLDTVIAEDSQVVLVGGTHYENHFGTSVVFNQVAGTTAYVRYCSFQGTTTWTHGQVNMSNVDSYVSTVNTTGSTGLISNSQFSRAYCPNLRNVTSLTITDCEVSGYSQISVTGATRVYLLRAELSSAARVLVSAGATLNSTNLSLSSAAYVQVTAGSITVNTSQGSGGSYIQHASTGTNIVSNCQFSSRGTIRFLNTCTGCRIYYTSVSGGGKAYHQGTSTGAYIYYSGVGSNASLHTDDSTNTRMYYCEAISNGQVYSTNNSNTHYIYYCTALSNARVHMDNCTSSRMYSITASSTSIARLRNSTSGRFYYSSVTAYYYLYITLTTTRSGIHAYGRRTNSVTDPSNGTATENFI